MLTVRYSTETGEITGVFPEGTWEGNLPGGMDILQVSVDAETEQDMLQSAYLYYVADSGTGPQIYKRSDENAPS